MENRKFEVEQDTGVSNWQNKKLLWISALAVLLVVALVIGLIVAPNSAEEEKQTDATSSTVRMPESDPTEELEEVADSDGDGIPDEVEIAGWEIEDGTIYKTDPHKADTDSDGLSDLEEAGEVISGEGLDVIYAGITNPEKADSDDDGLNDKVELDGWKTVRGLRFITDPMNSDSDDDGLPDGAEAGKVTENADGDIVYSGFSDPTVKDTDGDGLNDLEEADSLTNPYSADADGDGLEDAYEARVIGTDPTKKRTDGDGFNDAFEDQNRDTSLKLDPLFEDKKVTRKEYAVEFATGFFAGEAKPVDSMAWFAGYLSATSFSLIPVLGWIVGSFTDIRDTVLALIQRDWVSGAFSVLGILPYAGDAAGLIRKTTKFTDNNPKMVARVGGAIAEHQHLPKEVKVQISKKVWKKWNSLLGLGATQDTLLALQLSGRLNLNEIADFLERDGHVVDQAVLFVADTKTGERDLEGALRKKYADVQTQVVALTEGCGTKCSPIARKFDVVADGTAHEVKVGYTVLTSPVQAQIFSDAYLLNQDVIEDVHWHFYPSDYTQQLGASKEVLDLLDKKGIKYTIHLPRA